MRLIVYEIEKNLSEKKKREKINRLKEVKDIFIIDLKKVPDDFESAEKFEAENCMRKCLL